MLNRIRSIGSRKGIIKSGDVDAVERLEKEAERIKGIAGEDESCKCYYRKNKTLDKAALY